jgi:hypothetical protein
MIRDEYSWMDNHVNRLLDGTPEEARVTSPADRFAAEPRSGQPIRFRLGDVYAPALPELFKQITPGLELEGRITLLSDGGENHAAYALVEVPGVLLPVIVPASCLELVSSANSEE